MVNHGQIANMLAQHHEGVDRFNLEEEELRNMVRSMPNFTGTIEQMSADDLFMILLHWFNHSS
jgi:hypothetical protein